MTSTFQSIFGLPFSRDYWWWLAHRLSSVYVDMYIDEGLQFRYSCCGLLVSALSISVDIVSLPFLSCLVPLFLLWLGGYTYMRLHKLNSFILPLHAFFFASPCFNILFLCLYLSILLCCCIDSHLLLSFSGICCKFLCVFVREISIYVYHLYSYKEHSPSHVNAYIFISSVLILFFILVFCCINY